MIKVKKVAKDHIQCQKKLYAILIGIMVAAFLCGIFYITMLSKSDKSLVTTELTNFFQAIKQNQFSSFNGLKDSLLANGITAFLIWILGMSIVGLPIVCGVLFIKTFSVGFSISSIIANFGFKGILGAITYIFPHLLLSLVIWLLLTFYAVSFSIKLFKALFLKQTINFKEVMERYVKILLLSLGGLLLCSLIECYLAPYLMKLFTFLI